MRLTIYFDEAWLNELVRDEAKRIRNEQGQRRRDYKRFYNQRMTEQIQCSINRVLAGVRG